jgi:hypothetical protein
MGVCQSFYNIFMGNGMNFLVPDKRHDNNVTNWKPFAVNNLVAYVSCCVLLL